MPRPIYRFRRGLKWVNAEWAHYVRSSSTLIPIVVMTPLIKCSEQNTAGTYHCLNGNWHHILTEHSYWCARSLDPRFLLGVTDKKSPHIVVADVLDKFLSGQILMRFHWIFWCIYSHDDFTTPINSKCWVICYSLAAIPMSNYGPTIRPPFGGLWWT